MIDYGRINEVDELTKKYEKISQKKSFWNIKLGAHPSVCEFKITINSSPDTIDVYVYETIDDLIDKLKGLCEEAALNARFKIGETVWFKDCDGKICSFCVRDIKKRDESSFIYFDTRGDYVTDEDNLFKSRNDLIEHEIKELEALKENHIY